MCLKMPLKYCKSTLLCPVTAQTNIPSNCSLCEKQLAKIPSTSLFNRAANCDEEIRRHLLFLQNHGPSICLTLKRRFPRKKCKESKNRLATKDLAIVFVKIHQSGYEQIFPLQHPDLRYSLATSPSLSWPSATTITAKLRG